EGRRGGARGSATGVATVCEPILGEHRDPSAPTPARVATDLCSQRSHPAKVVRCRLSRLFKIVIRLESHPELLGRTERPSETECRIGRYRALAQDDLVDAPRRYTDRARQSILANVHWLQELLQKYLPRVNIG